MSVVSYTDSGFTRAHDVVSLEEKKDHRGTFSHVGVRMEGLESRRHLNFKFQKQSDVALGAGGLCVRDAGIRNELVLMVGEAGVPGANRALISKIALDTAFFTRNNVRTCYSVVFIDELTDKTQQHLVAENILLKGDALHEIEIEPTHATRIILKLSEGGLCRFHAYGEAAVDQLPLPENLLSQAHVFGATDLSYGAPELALRRKREGLSMNGWETCRNSYRQRLGISVNKAITPKSIEIDTYMHLLNNFQVFCLLGCQNAQNLSEDELIAALPDWTVTDSNGSTTVVKDSEINDFVQKLEDNGSYPSYQMQFTPNSLWRVIVPMSSLYPDRLHTFAPTANNTNDNAQVTHFMLYGLPDGGIHRIGVY